MNFLGMSLLSLAFSVSALACPGAGQVNLLVGEELFGTLNTYDSNLKVSEGYEVLAVSSQLASLPIGVFPYAGRNLEWVCTKNQVSDAKLCSELQTEDPHVYSMPQGPRHFVVRIKKSSQENDRVFEAFNVNMDPNQPRAKGGCGSDIQSK